MKPMIKYRGGKSRELANILQYVPRFCGRYLEPFVGGGAVFFALEPRQSVINDINSRLISFYRGVRDDYGSLRAELDSVGELYGRNRADFEELKRQHPEEKVEDANERLYYDIRDMYNGLSHKVYSDALLYFFINKTAYSGMIRYNARGEFNVPFGRYKSINTSLVTSRHSALLRNAEVLNADYSAVFNLSEPDDFMFLDPPYDCVFSDYGNAQYKEGFTEADHRRLANDFRNLSCKALMVIGRTPLTMELYGRYIVDDYQKNYAVNIRNRFKSSATHIVVANYRKADVRQSMAYGVSPEVLQPSLFEPDSVYGKEYQQ